MPNGDGQDTQKKQEGSGYTKVIMPDGKLKYFPSSLGEARIRQLATSQTSTPTKSPDKGIVSKAFTPLVSSEAIDKFIEKSLGGKGEAARHALTEKAIEIGTKHGRRPIPGLMGLDTKAGRAALGEGTAKSVTELLSQFTSPVQLSLMVASGGGGLLAKVAPEAKILMTALKVPGLAAMVGFGVRGLADAATPKQKDESNADAIERRLYGASAFLSFLGGASATGKDAIHAVLRRQMGLNEDLAAKVSDTTQKIAAERSKGVAEKSRVDALAAERAARIDQATAQNVSQAKGLSDQRVSAITSGMDREIASLQGETSSKVQDINRVAERKIAESKGKISDLEAQKIKAGAQIVSDASLAIDIERGRVSAPFEDIGRRIKSPVTTTSGVRAMVASSFQEHGVKESEIPSAAFKALGKPPAGGDLDVVSPNVSSMEDNPEFAAAQKAARGDDTVSFNDLTRVRDDLWQASQGAKDGGVRTSLLDARNKVTDLQKSAAEKAGLGKAYETAKNNYRDFKRGVGSDLAADLVDAKDAESQAMVPKIKMLLNENTTEALRTVLASVGVDVKPLTEIIEGIKEEKMQGKTLSPERKAQLAELTRESTKRDTEIRSRYGERLSSEQRDVNGAVSDIEGAASEQSEFIEKEAKESGKAAIAGAEERVGKLKDIPTREQVVPGVDVESLSGQSNDQLLRGRVKAILDRGVGSGVGAMTSMVMSFYGLVRMAAGSPFGGIMLARGMSSLEIPELVRNKTFQDWLIRKSGVEPSSKLGMSMRIGIRRLYPLLRRLATSGQTEAVTSGAARNRHEPPTREEVLQDQQ